MSFRVIEVVEKKTHLFRLFILRNKNHNFFILKEY